MFCLRSCSEMPAYCAIRPRTRAKSCAESSNSCCMVSCLWRTSAPKQCKREEGADEHARTLPRAARVTVSNCRLTARRCNPSNENGRRSARSRCMKRCSELLPALLEMAVALAVALVGGRRHLCRQSVVVVLLLCCRLLGFHGLLRLRFRRRRGGGMLLAQPACAHGAGA